MPVKVIGLIEATEIFIEMSDSRNVGTFKIEKETAAGPFSDQLVQQVMIGMEGTTGGEGSGLQQREPAVVLQEDGCGEPLLFIAENASDHQLSFLLPMEAYAGEMMIVLTPDMGGTVSI